MIIHEIEECDIDLIRRWKNANKEFFFFKGEISPERQQDWYTQYLTRDDDYMYMVWFDNKNIGCMGIRYEDNIWEVYNVILGEIAYKGTGIMSYALREMIRRARLTHRGAVTARVLLSNPAIKWYEKNGFSVIKQHQDYNFLLYRR